MRKSFLMAATSVALMAATPTIVRAQGVGQLLQGLTTGNQTQDKALQEAYERGYQKGRQDEAQLARRSGRSDSGRSDNGRTQAPYDQGNSRTQAPYDQGNSYRR